ncbi:GNAT family N-acetyltransferase [Actinomadura sp. SCN-SB]|uniref:GNAT family N-acetyltransferase n=1 Tax=Actinomadura sp. SCN-SB TaxID=3373092 RepID=UPI0037536B74
MDLRLNGHGLVLRRWREDDLPTMVELFDDPDIAYRTPLASPFDLAAARAYLDKAHRLYIEGQRIQLAITEEGDDRPLGEVLFNRAGRTIGYGIGAAHRRRRLAVRAVRVLTDYAHRRLGLPHVYLEIEPDNDPSKGVARAAGYRPTGRPPQPVTDKGRVYTLETWVHDAPATP